MPDNSKISFAIVGSGGLGSYLGAKLARAGYPTTFVARGAHLEAMKRSGLRVEGPDEAFTVSAPDITNSPKDLEPVDFLLFCVKMWDTEGAAHSCRSIVAPNTAALSFQNGVDAAPMLADILGERHVMGAVAEVGANLIEPGFVKRHSPVARIRFGEFADIRSKRAADFAVAMQTAGFEVDHSSDIEAAIWTKFLAAAAVSGLCGLTRQPFGVVRNDPELRDLLGQAMTEIVAVAQARGIALAEDAIEATMAYVDRAAPSGRPSMAVDLEHGKRLELPWLSGAVVRMGDDVGIETPVHRFIGMALKHQILGSR